MEFSRTCLNMNEHVLRLRMLIYNLARIVLTVCIIFAMSIRTRNLLDRFRKLILPSVRLIDDSSLTIDIILRAVNVSQLVEATEVARVIFNEIKPALVNGESQADVIESEVKQVVGVSYWTRQLLLQAAQQARQSAEHPIAKALEDLQDVVQLISRKVKKLNVNRISNKAELRIRNYVQIVRTFYEYADWTLPVY